MTHSTHDPQPPSQNSATPIPDSSPTGTAELSGARESNAGDDFHFLWAVRSALQLVYPSTELSGVVVEGASTADSSLVGRDDLLLGIDLTEYYGGNDFETASRVVFSQLKYSTRHPSTAWTAARLRERRSTRTNDSVIRRLASIAEAFLKTADADEVKKKLTIRLVSNQPVADGLKEAVAEAQQVLKQQPITSAANLLRALDEPSRTQIQSLQQASALTSGAFVVFLSVLDLSQCGTASRALLRIETLRNLGLSSLAPAEDLRKLYDLIKDLAAPGQDGYVITRHDVHAALGLGDDSSLFPAPPKFHHPQPTIATEDARRIADFIRAHRGEQVIVHGPAGIGKTTTSLQIKEHLPPGSEVFQYDCYGGGDYLNLGQERHRPEECFIQLCNEFAVRLGTPFFLHRVTNPIDAGRVFTSRVARASQAIGPDGLLVIIADAADNAVTAAEQLHSPCFVPDLRRLDLPSNCCVVYSCRTHRKDLIEASSLLADIELAGFSPQETASYTKVRLPAANDLLCEEVHRLSQGVPRFQSYLLSQLGSGDPRTAESPDDLLRLLRKISPRVLDDVFEGIVAKAGQELTEAASQPQAEGTLPALLQSETDKLALTNLVFLARPITLEEYAALADLAINRAERFCHALRPGLTVQDRTLSFRDEDFEVYLRSKFNDVERADAWTRLSTKLLERCKDEPYAATHVADYLAAAKRWEEVIHLALDGPEPDSIPDEVTRLHVRRKRFAAGLTACAATRNFTDAARLLVHAAEAQRTSETVFTLVRQHPDLAALYGDVERLGAIYLREHEEAMRSKEGQHESWLGAAHMRVAGMYASRPELHDLARDHLQAAGAWMRVRQNLSENERYEWNITNEDVASETEAVFHLGGPEAAIRSILRWRPLEFVREAARLAIHQLRGHLDDALAETLLREAEQAIPARFRTWGTVYLAACLWAEGIRVSRATLDRIAARAERAVSRGARPHFTTPGVREDTWSALGWSSTFVEALVISGVPTGRIERLIEALAPARPRYAPSGPDFGRWDAVLRSELLLAQLQQRDLSVEDLEPEEWKAKGTDDRAAGDTGAPGGTGRTPSRPPVDEEERRRFRTLVGSIFPAYTLWAEAITRPCAVADISERAQKNIRGASGWSQYEAEAFSFRQRCEITWEAICCCSDIHGPGRPAAIALLQQMVTNAEQSDKVNTAGCCIRFAELAVRVEATRNTALEILERVGSYVGERPMPARERWDALMRCARIALPYAPELCQDFYRRAIEAAEDVDDESLPFITALSSLARSLAGTGTDEQRRRLAASLQAVAVEYRLRLSDENRTPWDEALQGMAALDPRTGLWACYHWDRQNIRDIDLSLPAVLAEGVRQHQIEPVTAIALLALARGDWEDRVERYGPDERFGASVPYRESLLALKRLGPSSAEVLQASLSEVCDRLLRDFGPASRKRLVPAFVKWADDHGIGGAPLEQLRTVAAFCDTLPEEDSRSSYTADPEWEARWAAEQAEQRHQLDELLVQARRGELSQFSERFAEARRLDYENGSAQFTRTLADHVPYAQRPALIQKVIALVPERWGDTALNLAAELADRWRANPAVVRAATEAVADLLRGNARAVVHQFDALAALTDTPPENLLTIYLEAIGSSIAAWDSGALYLAFRHVSQHLQEADRWAIALIAAEHLLAKIEVAPPDPPDLAPDLPQAVAGLLFALCGHVDAYVRWDALYAARFLVRAGQTSLLDTFVPFTHSSEAPPGFAQTEANGERFRWMTARVYSLLLLERLADESPAAVRPFTTAIEEHLFSQIFPHAQVRELARRALLRLAAAYEADFESAALWRIERANRPAICLYPRRSPHSQSSGRVAWTHGGHVTSAGERYKFDSLDVIPYWFEPAARVFHVGTDSFVRAAESWVVDHWGINKTNARAGWDWETLERRYPNGAWDDRHGTLPRVETPSTYLAFHAEQCVMGQLVDSLPVSVDPHDYEDEPTSCPWEEWLSRFLPGEEGFWLADLRQPTPLSNDLWQSAGDVHAWIATQNESDFDQTASTSPDSDSEWTLVYGSVSYYSDTLSASSQVVSALVLPTTATSLLRALEAAGPRNWQLPIHGWSHDEWAINEDGFNLQDWLIDRRYPEGFDHLDPRARDTPASSRMELGEAFCRMMEVTRAKDGLNWRDGAGQPVGRTEYWSDNPQTQRLYAFFSYGCRIWVRTGVLLEYLRRCGLDLIVSTLINRNYSYEYTQHREAKRRDDAERVRLHLLRRDGNIETMAGGRAIGTAHPEGAEPRGK